MIAARGDILLCFWGGVLVFFSLYHFSFRVCSMSERNSHAASKTCRVSSSGSVCDLFNHCACISRPSPFPFSTFGSLACSRRHDRTVSPGRRHHRIGRPGCRAAGRIGREACGLPRCVFSAPVSKKHSVAVWREECLCVARVGLPCQHFKPRLCTYL